MSYLHPPFVRKRCKKCHFKKVKGRKNASYVQKKYGWKVLKSSSDYEREHIYLSPQLKKDTAYYLNIRSIDISGNQILTQLEDIKADKVSRIIDNKKLLKISIR